MLTVNKGANKINRTETGSIANNRPPIANNQSPLRASLAWCKEENEATEAKKAGISIKDPNDSPRIAYRIKHEAIKGIPRESKGHMVRLSKFEDHFERAK